VIGQLNGKLQKPVMPYKTGSSKVGMSTYIRPTNPTKKRAMKSLFYAICFCSMIFANSVYQIG